MALPLFAAEPMVVFSVHDPGSPAGDPVTIEPIAMIVRDEGEVKYLEPPRGFGDPQPDAPTKAFDVRYYRQGKTYRVVSGGAEVGTVRVKHRVQTGCVSLAAAVELKAKPDLGTGHMALALGSLRSKPRTMTTRDLTKAEGEKFLALVQRALELKGVPPKLAATAELNGLATDLHGDGAIDFVGWTQVMGDGVYYRLALTAQQRDGQLGADFLWFLTARNPDEETEQLAFVDHFDFDDDGVDELVFTSHGKESTFYEIWRRRPSDAQWERVYMGGGAGC